MRNLVRTFVILVAGSVVAAAGVTATVPASQPTPDSTVAYGVAGTNKLEVTSLDDSVIIDSAGVELAGATVAGPSVQKVKIVQAMAGLGKPAMVSAAFNYQAFQIFPDWNYGGMGVESYTKTFRGAACDGKGYQNQVLYYKASRWAVDGATVYWNGTNRCNRGWILYTDGVKDSFVIPSGGGGVNTRQAAIDYVGMYCGTC